jgi:hypothetical protein
MPIRKTRFHALQVTCFVLLTWILTYAQANPKGPSAASARPDYSGMYGFLTEGEFVQVTVEDHGHVTGFVSRYGDSEADHGVFLDHFFESGTLDGNQLTFATRTVHGVSFEFRGTVERGEGRSRSHEAYYVLKGTLIENSTDDAKKVSAHSRQVALKSFPQDMSSPPADKK